MKIIIIIFALLLILVFFESVTQAKAETFETLKLCVGKKLVFSSGVEFILLGKCYDDDLKICVEKVMSITEQYQFPEYLEMYKPSGPVYKISANNDLVIPKETGFFLGLPIISGEKVPCGIAVLQLAALIDFEQEGAYLWDFLTGYFDEVRGLFYTPLYFLGTQAQYFVLLVEK